MFKIFGVKVLTPNILGSEDGVYNAPSFTSGSGRFPVPLVLLIRDPVFPEVVDLERVDCAPIG